jgi:tRNA threonylcarbamoyladenosine biosynthesis protein TsaB
MRLAFFTKDRKSKMKETEQTRSPYFLVIYGSYQDISLGLYRGAVPHRTQTAHAVRASAQLLPLIDHLLSEQKCSLSDLDFIALDQGPGAFTSLRVVLTTMNGISFAKKVPLVGCDGLRALADQMEVQAIQATNKPELLVALLNAYNNEVYYHFSRLQKDGSYQEVKDPGYADIGAVIGMITKQEVSSVWCAGNGANVYREVLVQQLGASAHIDQVLRHADLDTLAQHALTQWHEQEEPCYNLQPNYLKVQSFVKAA